MYTKMILFRNVYTYISILERYFKKYYSVNIYVTMMNILSAYCDIVSFKMMKWALIKSNDFLNKKVYYILFLLYLRFHAIYWKKIN